MRHRRFTPVQHRFTYRISMLMLDLDHADTELTIPPLAGTSRWRIGAWLRRDYAGDVDLQRSPTAAADEPGSKYLGQALKNHVIEAVDRELSIQIDGKVLLLTHLRYWGFMMNPIAVFYCYDQQFALKAVVLQVTNTPWREKVLYVLPANSEGTTVNRFDKSMHVSPYNPMDMTYLCRLQNPEKRLFLHLENHRVEGESIRHTDATMVFDRSPLDRRSLALLCLTQPAMTIKVGFGIYWQALRLWLKRSPIYDHPASRDQNLDTPSMQPTHSESKP